jgi:two-component system, cell cycle response regulator DivK
MKVLIVDDNKSLQNLLARVLEHLDYLPVLASHGKDGFEKAIAEKPDLILMDMQMPIMDGWEATRALRANPETKNIPILATTVLFRPLEVKTCLEAVCNGYIVKPFTVMKLQRKIAELLAAPLAQVSQGGLH